MRRRDTPYSRLAEIRASRGELLALVLVTLALGLALNLASNALYEILAIRGMSRSGVLLITLFATLGMTLIAVWLFHSQTESRTVQLEVWLPYHLPGGERVTIAHQPAYQVTAFARQAWARRYPENAPLTQDWLARWRQARAEGVPFQTFALAEHVALCQCLLLYALRRAGDDMLGPEAEFGWWAVDLPAQSWSIDALSPPVRDNPFLRADQLPDQWRLLLPRDVTLTLATGPDNPLRQAQGKAWPRWTLRHPRYGQLDLRWRPQVAVAGRGGQVWRILTQHLRLGQRSELYVLNARLEARAHFRWTLLPRSDPFHQWATSLLARLEEALDWGYFIETRPNRILADLDWKIGWWERDDSLADTLARIERRLEELESDAGEHRSRGAGGQGSRGAGEMGP